jgi:hypothetical protein
MHGSQECYRKLPPAVQHRMRTPMIQSSGMSLQPSSCTWRLQTSAARCGTSQLVCSRQPCVRRPAMALAGHPEASFVQVLMPQAHPPTVELLTFTRHYAYVRGICMRPHYASPDMTAYGCRKSRSTGLERSAGLTADCRIADGCILRSEQSIPRIGGSSESLCLSERHERVICFA